METTTCLVLCVLIIAWASVKISELYFRSNITAGFSWLDFKKEVPAEAEDEPTTPSEDDAAVSQPESKE